MTEVTTTEAIASDLSGMKEALGAQEARGEEKPEELYVDAAYVTDDTLAEAEREERELVGPARPAPGRGGMFSADEFEVDVSNREAICPAGKRNSQCSLINDAHKGESFYRFEWAGQCDECPLRNRCTNSKTGRRILMVGVRHDLLQGRRRAMETEAYQRLMRRRNGIEGTISELVRLGMRRTRYRGLAKTRLANYFLGAACNVNRWLRLVAYRMREAPSMG